MIIFTIFYIIPFIICTSFFINIWYDDFWYKKNTFTLGEFVSYIFNEALLNDALLFMFVFSPVFNIIGSLLIIAVLLFNIYKRCAHLFNVIRSCINVCIKYIKKAVKVIFFPLTYVCRKISNIKLK